MKKLIAICAILVLALTAASVWEKLMRTDNL